jgi:hexosaminidase
MSLAQLSFPMILVAFSLEPASFGASQQAALMPLPAKVEASSGRLLIDGSFQAAAAGVSGARLDAALRRFTARLARQTGMPIGLGQLANQAHPTLLVDCGAPSETSWPALGDDESYTLNVSPEGARLKAATLSGVLRGLETFSQLVSPTAEGFAAAAVHIEDRPRFPWRGLMLDVSRHWMPLAVVERNLDAMAAVKLNVFHWHLSDDQGFRVESKRFPKLQELGSDGHFYTQDEIRQAVGYARDRGIRVIPEFDMPGHTQSWLAAYPELAAAPAPGPGTYQVGRTWGVYDPVLDPTREQTYQFLDTLISELAPLFPDQYFHIGGDEVRATQWNASPGIQAFAREHKLAGAHGLQVYFNQRIQKILEKNGKLMIGWDEILHPDLPSSIVIQSWRGQKSLADAAREGRRGILSWGYYLDHLEPARQHYGVDPLGGQASGLTADEAARVLGGEACMWSEYVSEETVDSRIWPRAAAIAERLWSPKEVTDLDSMYERMESVSRWLEWTGIRHRDDYGAMLDRLTGGVPSGTAEPLRILADASEALGLGPRARARKYTSLVPLNRFVDAVRPESEPVRALEQAALQSTSESLARLREQFAVWAANDARFQALAGNNALLAELKPLSHDLAALGASGLKALDYLAAAQPAPADWLAEQNREIARMLRPNAEVTLAAARPVRILLDRLSRKGQP